MLDLSIKQNELSLSKTEKKLFGLAFGKIIATYYQDKTNLKKFKENEKILKKEVKNLEVKRDFGKKEQKS